jgi:hypothetical protein
MEFSRAFGKICEENWMTYKVNKIQAKEGRKNDGRI